MTPVFDPADPPANEWPELHTDGPERLRYWRTKRASETPPTERTEEDWTLLAFTPAPLGTAAGCGCS